jgi:hypothetical protein
MELVTPRLGLVMVDTAGTAPVERDLSDDKVCGNLENEWCSMPSIGSSFTVSNFLWCLRTVHDNGGPSMSFIGIYIMVSDENLGYLNKIGCDIYGQTENMYHILRSELLNSATSLCQRILQDALVFGLSLRLSTHHQSKS